MVELLNGVDEKCIVRSWNRSLRDRNCRDNNVLVMQSRKSKMNLKFVTQESNRNEWVTLKDVRNIKAKLHGKGNDAIRTDVYLMALQEENYNPVLCYKRN